MKVRVVLFLLVVSLGLAIPLVPAGSPVWVLLLVGALFATMANVIMVDWSLRRQRRSEPAKRGGLLSRLGITVFLFGMLSGGTAFVLSQRGEMSDALARALLIGSAAFGGIGVLGLLFHLCVSFARPVNPLSELRASLPVKPLKQQIAEALEFQKVVGWRLLSANLMVMVVIATALMMGLAISASLIWLGIWLSNPFSVIDFEDWPILVKLGFFCGIAMIAFAISTTVLTLFRLVARARRIGRVRNVHAWRDIGLALETVGMLGTCIWGLAMTIFVAVIGFAAMFLHYFFVESLQFEPIATSLTVSVICLFLVWLLIFLPQMYVMAIMTKRDCGWMNAMEASLTLVELEGREAIVKAALATVLALTIVGIPGAVFLLLTSLDSQDLILAKVMGEKSSREIREALQEISSKGTGRLQRYEDLLAKGRYLDALNGYQMHLRTQRDDVEAARGEAIAYLCMGNPRARESVERWHRLDSESEEAARYLNELNTGRWAEDGDRFREADAKCTQRIGVGVSGMLAPPPAPGAPVRADIRIE